MILYLAASSLAQVPFGAQVPTSNSLRKEISVPVNPEVKAIHKLNYLPQQGLRALGSAGYPQEA